MGQLATPLAGFLARSRGLLERLPQGDRLPAEDWKRRHAGVRVLLATQAVGLYAFGLYQGTPLLHIGWETAGLLALLFLASVPRFGRRLQSVVASVGLITCSALLTHLSGGYIEAHFHFFVMLGIIVLYEDWIPFILSIGYVALHHGLVGTFDPRSVYNHPGAIANPWVWAGVHAFFILWLSSALILYWRISETLRAKTDLVLQSSPTGILGVDAQDRISFANAAAAQLANARPSELIGRQYQEILAVPHGTGAASVALLHPRGKEAIPVEVSAQVVPPSPARVGRVLSFTDIRQRLAAQRELQESEERFRSLSSSSPVGIFTTDTSGGAIYTNTRCQEICGFNATQALGTGWASFIHPEDRSRVVEQWRSFILESGTRAHAARFEADFRMENPKLGLRWVSGRAAPLFNDSGAVIGYVGTIEDITARHQANQRLTQFNQELEQAVKQRTRQLESTLRELESFNYSVSHDLRSPLRVISGFSELLLDSTGSALKGTDLDALREIRDASLRMNRTIEALLHLSTISRNVVNRKTVDVSELARVVGASLRRAHPDRDVELVVRPGLHADADPELLAVVFGNLLGNAWKFTAERRHARVEVDALESAGSTVFYVRDNGVGFEHPEGTKLFRAFTRLHDSQRFAGTGIGLATVARIVEKHGGHVRAIGEENQGAAVLFTLTAAPIPESIQRLADLPAPRVLVVASGTAA